MTTTPKVLVAAIIVPASPPGTPLYTSPATGKGTYIDRAESVCYGAGPGILTINVVTAGDTAGNQNLFVDAVSIANKANYACPELVGQFLGPGDFLSISGTATMLNIKISGRELT